MENTKEFGSIRKVLFPIYGHELRKVLPLFFLFMFIAACYFLLRSLKDMFILDYTGEAASLYFLKMYGVTPFIIILTIFYSKMANLHRDTRFFVMMGYFLVSIGLCYFIFLPNLDNVRLDSVANKLNDSFPKMNPLWECIRFWPCALLYLNAEAWGAMALGVLFWTFCNDIISFKDSKRIYGYLGSGAAVGTGGAGFILIHYVKNDFISGVGVAIVTMVIVTIIYFFISKDAKKNPALYQVESSAPKKKKMKMSLMESFKFLANSKHLALIATLVLCYGCFISLFESVAKAQNVKLTNLVGKEALASIYGYQGVLNATLSIILVFMSGWISKKGWKFTASVTPIMALICTSIFFLFLFGGDTVAALFSDKEGTVDITKILWITAVFGSINQVVIKATKYIMFDPTCNQAYIPLDEDTKVRGKAAVDGVGSRLGKSFGALLISAPGVGLFAIFGGVDNAKIVICLLIAFFLFVWIRSVGKLSNLLKSEEDGEKSEKK